MAGIDNNNINNMPETNELQAALAPGDALWDNEWQPGPGEATIQLRSNTANPKFTLYSSWFCPFAQRTWIACEETGVGYLWKEINPYKVDPNQAGGYTKLSHSLDEKRRRYPDFVDASPRGLVPAVAHTDTTTGQQVVAVWESLPSSEYVNTVFGDGSLTPSDPWEKAMTQIWCDHCTSRIQKEYYSALMAQDEAATLGTVFYRMSNIGQSHEPELALLLGRPLFHGGRGVGALLAADDVGRWALFQFAISRGRSGISPIGPVVECCRGATLGQGNIRVQASPDCFVFRLRDQCGHVGLCQNDAIATAATASAR